MITMPKRAMEANASILLLNFKPVPDGTQCCTGKMSCISEKIWFLAQTSNYFQ